MFMEKIRALLRVYTPGRRVTFLPEAVAAKGGVPAGVMEGVILKLIPLAQTAEPIIATLPLPDAFGVEIEYRGPNGLDAMVLPTEAVAFLPSDEDRLRAELLGRRVNFPRSSGIGIDFPPGAADDGIIVDIGYRDAPCGKALDRVVTIDIPIDPSESVDGDTVFRTEADFTQCQLMLRKA